MEPSIMEDVEELELSYTASGRVCIMSLENHLQHLIKLNICLL